MASRKTKNRSRAYPVVSLAVCFDLIRMVVRALDFELRDRFELAKAIGYTASTGLAARKVAAMAHFGLLERLRGSYRATELARKLIEAPPGRPRQIYLRKAFQHPPLFREIYTRYQDEGRLPELFTYRLVERHGISETARETVAQVFLDSARYAGLLDNDGNFQSPESEIVEPERPVLRPVEWQGVPEPDRSNEEVAARRQRIELLLPQGLPILLDLPPQLTFNDIQFLRRQLDVLEMTAIGPRSVQKGYPRAE